MKKLNQRFFFNKEQDLIFKDIDEDNIKTIGIKKLV